MTRPFRPMFRHFTLVALVAIGLASHSVEAASSRTSPAETVRKSAETQIRNLVEPVLERYCRDACKLLSSSVNVEISVPEETAPGFDDIGPVSGDDLAPTSGKIKILVDDKMGPVTREKLTDLVQRYLDTLDYPVKIDLQVAHFPSPMGSEGRVAELREGVARKFTDTVNELIQKYCPDQCILTDFDVKAEVVNPEEAQYGSPNEFVQEGGTALRIREISGTILMDEAKTPEERLNILEMIRLKTNRYKNVNLTQKSLKFPKPQPNSATSGIINPAEVVLGDGTIAGSHKQSSKDEKSETKQDKKETELKDSKATSESKQESVSHENKTIQSAQTSSTDSKSNSQVTNQLQNNETNQKQEKFERYEKIERVENGDAVQQEIKKFQLYALVFACSVIALLIFIAMATIRARRAAAESPNVVMASAPFPSRDNAAQDAPYFPPSSPDGGGAAKSGNLALKLEINRLTDELTDTFAQQPRVAKYVFSRVITEEGIETTAKYIHIFGENIVIDMLRDPGLQGDVNELIEFYARTPVEIEDDEALDLLKKLHQRTVSGKLSVMGKRSSNLFEFLAEMDAQQVLEMIRNESLTVKSIILTQCDNQKRSTIYNQFDEDTKLKLLTELSRIDYLPREYIFNVANALKRKRREDPRLNTEMLPGSEVLVSLLERTGKNVQRDVVKNLESNAPDSARTVKSKLVSIETLCYLRDGQLLEVVLSLKHDELLQFLKAASEEVREAIFAKSPKELVVELRDELEAMPPVHRENYFAIERKVLNRMKLMATDGLINLVETNERMFADPNRNHGPMSATISGVIAGSIGPSDGSTEAA